MSEAGGEVESEAGHKGGTEAGYTGRDWSDRLVEFKAKQKNPY